MLVSNVTYKVLNASDYGVAQERKRIFIVGIRTDLGLHFEFPLATHGNEICMWLH